MALQQGLPKHDVDVEVKSGDARDVSSDAKHHFHQKPNAAEDVLGGQGLDPVLTAKLGLLNDVRPAARPIGNRFRVLILMVMVPVVGHRRDRLDAIPLAALLPGWIRLCCRLHGHSHQERHPTGHYQRIRP